MKVASKLNNNNNNNRKYSKPAKSMDKVKITSKQNISIMDEKLSLLNSDIEELYKKYVEKKKIRRRKEKSEQSLVSRINFLIDEEKKIRSQIENKIKQCSKNRSVRVLKPQEIMINSGTTMRYNTIESSEDTPRTAYNFKYNVNKKINKILKDYESEKKNRKIKDFIKKNGLTDITLSSIQNNSSIDNNCITIGNRSTVTNNLCIIINNSDKTESSDNAKNKNNCNDISFAEKEKSNDINKNNNNENQDNNNIIEITENHCDEDKSNNKVEENENYLDNFKKDNENNEEINHEIQYIKMSLVPSVNGDNTNAQPISQTYQQKDEIKGNENKKFKIYVNELTEKKDNFKEHKDFIPQDLEDNMKTPSFKEKSSKNLKISKEIKDIKEIKENKEKIRKENRSLKSLLDSKKKILENLQNELRLKRINLDEKKSEIENRIKNRNKSDINLNIKMNIKANNINNKINKNKNNKNKRLDKRSYSKPNNKIQNKEFKTFNHNNLQKTLSPNRSKRKNIINVINKISISNDKKNKSNTKKYNKNNISIDSEEIIISDVEKNSSYKKLNKKEEEELNKKMINTFFKNINKKNKNKVKEKPEQKNNEKIYYEYESTPNLLKNNNMTFNQSIEKKRQLLGIPSNVKINDNKNNNPVNIQKKDNKVKFILVKKNNNINKKKNKNKNKKDVKNEPKFFHKYKNKNKSTKTFYEQIPKNTKIWNINSINSDSKDLNYDIESNPQSNYEINHNEICKKLFKNNDGNSVKNNNYFETKDRNNKNIASNSSLTSLFSTQTNKTNKTNKTTTCKKSNKSNLIKYNNNIIMTKKENENKNFLSTIRIIKKRDKNKENKNQNENEEKLNELNEDINNNNKNKNIELNSNKKIEKEPTKFFENEIKPRRQLAAIRRINLRIENYKKSGPQIHNLIKKHKNRFDGNNYMNRHNYFSNLSNSNKKNNYQFNTYRRLSEIQKKPNSSFSKHNVSANLGVAKSKSNRSLTNYKQVFKI
jgi:hypothetical protein